jgi:hypothetical protein
MYQALKARPEGSRGLGEIAGAALGPFALLAFGHVLDLSVFENRLHFNFTAAAAQELVRAGRGTGVLGCLGHGFPPSK